MHTNKDTTQFAPMKPLGFPSKELVSPAGRYMTKQFALWKRHLHANTGLGLNVKPFNGSSSKSKKSKSKNTTTATTTTQTIQQNDLLIQQQPQQQSSNRVEKWNIPKMSAYGQYIQQHYYSPTKMPGEPSHTLFPSTSSRIWPFTLLISLKEQDRLIDLYFEHIHTSMPLLDILTMKQQLANCRAKDKNCFLSPLFFYALFALASCYEEKSERIYSLSDQFMQQAIAYREASFGYPCIATVLALLLMVEYLQQKRQRSHASYAWLLAGEAIRMVTDLEMYRPCNVSPEPADQELVVRTFWAAFTTDRLMSLTYGRPFIFEEKDIGVALPKISAVEKANFPETEQYLKNFIFLIDVSKVVGRIIRFNYSVQSAQLRVASLHQEAMLSTLDSWTSTLIKDAKQCIPFADSKQQQFEKIKQLLLHTLLILLHQPYVDHSVPTNNGGPKRNGESRHSFDICSYSAIIVTQLAYDLSKEELEYMVKRSSILYTLITAMRVHLMNASYTTDQEWATNGEFSFLQSKTVIDRVIAMEREQRQEGHKEEEVSLLATTINLLTRHFYERPDPVLSSYANAQDHILKSAIDASTYILSLPPATPTSSPSFEQFLPDSSTTSSSSSSLSTGVPMHTLSLSSSSSSPGIMVMDGGGGGSSNTINNNNNDGFNIFNDHMNENQGDISFHRLPPPSLRASCKNNPNKHSKFIAFNPDNSATSSSGGNGGGSGAGKSSSNRLYTKEGKQRNKKRRPSPIRDEDTPMQQPEPLQQQFDFLQPPATTTTSPEVTAQYQKSTISENQIIQQQPSSFQQYSQQSEQQSEQHFQHFQTLHEQQQQQQQQQHHHQHYHHTHHHTHQGEQLQNPEQMYTSNNTNPTTTTTTASDLTFDAHEIQQILANPNLLIRASQAYQQSQGMEPTTQHMFFNPTVQMTLDDPITTAITNGLTNTTVTMATQMSGVNNNNNTLFNNSTLMNNPLTTTSMAYSVPNDENLHTYYFSP
ncbi:hypothetical protein INT45_004316 [Circinella minor]|uniref:Xylanolytic transcriptional activator regulatory domain-containing protein n=1 Tax=Circinella minor TaxID=1195481 RepID=A0A8H7VLR5_9FUNG|nr:hypothetical protein INT45_004316 [Circinella minor]